MTDTDNFKSTVHQCIRNCVTCNHRAINGIEWPCMVCSQNVAHKNAKDMWEG